MTEEWRPVVGYEGLYEVSNLGKVKSLRRTTKYITVWGGTASREFPELIMRPSVSGNGYEQIHLKKGKDKRLHYVHRIVAEAFVPKEEGKNIVNHLDMNRLNNSANNLEWTDYFGNLHWSMDSYRHSHNSPIPSTGYKYISKYKNKSKDGEKEYFKVRVGDKQRNATTIEEAISIREELLNAR